MKIISPCQSKMQLALFKHEKCLSQVFNLFLCIFINDMHSFTEKSDDLVLIGACSLFKTVNYGNQGFPFSSCPYNASSSTSMVQPGHESSKKPKLAEWHQTLL